MPNADTVWVQQGGTNTIAWTLFPLTNPAPATQFFDVYLRNGVGTMYSPPLNESIATMVDSTAGTSIVFDGASTLKVGPGYQLFFSDPTDAGTVYCDTPTTFSIAAGTATESSSTDGSGVDYTTTTSTTTVQPTPSSTGKGSSNAATTSLAPVQAPGGLAAQGLGESFSAASRFGVEIRWIAVTLAVGTVLFGM